MNPLSKLNPKQKRMVIAAGIAGLLALMVMLSRRGAPAPTPVTDDAGSADASTDDAGLDSTTDGASSPQSYDFAGAGNDDYVGQLGSATVDALGSLESTVAAAHLNKFPKANSALRHQNDKLRSQQKKLHHRIDQLQGEHHGGGGKGGGKSNAGGKGGGAHHHNG